MLHPPPSAGRLAVQVLSITYTYEVDGRHAGMDLLNACRLRSMAAQAANAAVRHRRQDLSVVARLFLERYTRETCVRSRSDSDRSSIDLSYSPIRVVLTSRDNSVTRHS